jgi:hypothetical protein
LHGGGDLGAVEPESVFADLAALGVFQHEGTKGLRYPRIREKRLVMRKELSKEQRDAAGVMLQRGVDWLLSAQAKDGAWHSETYGALKQGAATTALVFYGLAQLPPSFAEKTDSAIANAIKFLKVGIEKTKTVACPDGTFDYPTYAAAQALTASHKLRKAGRGSLSDVEENTLARFLIAAQLDERREFAPESPHYGGWDLLGTQLVKKLTTETNVSLGLFALEAIAELKTPEAAECRKRALGWTLRAQNLPGDGGFAFSGNKDSLANKAAWLDKEHTKPRSYGSATCDGLRCLLFAGEKSASASVKAAIGWLENHPAAKLVTGFEELKDDSGWAEGLRFYYYAGVADCLRYCGDRFVNAVREDLLYSLSKQQLEKGYWQNESARMREDDPLIATSLALLCLSRILA